MFLEEITKSKTESEEKARNYIKNKYGLTGEQLEKGFAVGGTYDLNKDNMEDPKDVHDFLDGAIPVFVRRKNKAGKEHWDCFGFAFWMVPEVEC